MEKIVPVGEIRQRFMMGVTVSNLIIDVRKYDFEIFIFCIICYGIFCVLGQLIINNKLKLRILAQHKRKFF